MKRKNKHPEADLQKQVVEYLRVQYPDALFTATLGGLRLTMGQAISIKRMGYLNGIPDILIFNGGNLGKGLAIELKSPVGKVRPEQAEVCTRLVKLGWECLILRTFEDCKEVIDNHLKGKK